MLKKRKDKEKTKFSSLLNYVPYVPTCLWKIMWIKSRPEILFSNFLKNAPFCMKFGTQPN